MQYNLNMSKTKLIIPPKLTLYRFSVSGNDLTIHQVVKARNFQAFLDFVIFLLYPIKHYILAH